MNDTTPDAMAVFLECHRRMSPEQKLELCFVLSEQLRQWLEAGVRMRHPQADEREVFLRTVSLRLDRETMRKVYQWDPVEHG